MSSRRILYTLFIIISIVSFCPVSYGVYTKVAPHPEWKNALQPKDGTAKTIQLTEGGQARYSILLPESPTTQEIKAAQDLATWLEGITRADFVIVLESNSTSETGPVVSVGNTNKAKDSNLTFSQKDLGNEGYAIEVHDGNLYLLGGKTRGIINAVYALLEEDIGCRWYARDSVMLPNDMNLTINAAQRSYVPRLELRDPFYFTAFDGTWSLRNRTNAPRAQVPEAWGGNVNYSQEWFAHTYERLVPPENYYDDHPEYFALVNGRRSELQICVTEPAVFDIALQNLMEAIETNPNAEYFSVSQNDNGDFCRCDRCRAINEREGTQAGTVIWFINKLANEVKKKHPDVKLTTLAYQATFVPPKTLRPADNVFIKLCTDRHIWPYPFLTVRETEAFQNAMKGWAKQGAKIHIWDYTVSFGNYLKIWPNMPIVSKNMQFYLDHNARGIMLQGAYQSPGADLARMKSWVWAKQMWDMSYETTALMKDFVYGYYGQAAEPIWAYVQMQNRLWEKAHAGGGQEQDLQIDVQYITQADQHISKAFELAVGNQELVERIELLSLPVLFRLIDDDYERLCRTGNVPDRKQFIQRVDRFERICLREGVTFLHEWPQPNFAVYIEQIRKRLNPTSEETKRWATRTPQGHKVDILRLRPAWRFRTDPGNVGVKNQWYAESLNEDGWTYMWTDTGSGWERQGFDRYDGYAWYRQEIHIPADMHGKHAYLFFGAVDENAYVYIDGSKAFEHTTSSTGLPGHIIWNKPFGDDVKEHISPGSDVLFAVRVFDNRSMGGVWKPVYLIYSDVELGIDEMTAITGTITPH